MTDKSNTRSTRADAAQQSWASARLEGFIPSVEDLALNQLWIDGQLSTEDLIVIHKERFRKGHPHG